MYYIIPQEQEKKDTNKKGSILLLTLIITMIILTSSVVLGTLIIGSLRRSQGEAAAISAYYAAESVMEKTLYDLRKVKKTLGGVVSNDCVSLPGGGFPGMATTTCSIKSDLMKSIFFLGNNKIKENQTVHIRLVDPGGDTVEAGVKKININCLGSGPWLEVTETPISGSSWNPDPSNIKKYLFPCPQSGNGYEINLDEDESFDIAIKALYLDVNSVTVKAYDENGNPANMGESFTIRSIVDYSNFSRQEIKVEMKGISTVSSLFDYVLYSEQAITKDILPGTT